MEMIECTNHLGGKVMISVKGLVFRPSVYALLIHEDKVLLMNTIHTNTYSLPGGGVEIGETNDEALSREVKEETGLEFTNAVFQTFQQDFFYYPPNDESFHTFLFFYTCTPLTLEPCADEDVQDGAVGQPRWVEIATLSADQFHNHGDLIMGILGKL